MKNFRAAILLVAALCQAAVPTPKEHFGYTPGADYKLADYNDIITYFQKLARASDRILLAEFGKTDMGKPMYIAYISAPENLKKLDQYRDISRRLALGEPEEAEARQLAEQGKAIVWIDSGLHASEVAPAQHSPELAYRMLTDDSAEAEAIRRQVILLQVPVINPDGLDMIAHWYRENVGTPYETAPLPRLYQKYAGHDNNRDWFMLNLVETRAVTKLLFHDWFPQIVYNQHQAPPFPARIFVPPYAEPLNPNIPAAVMEGINMIGMAIKERFARENKPGVLSYHGFDGWWNGGLRSVPAFHNMHGILTETAGNFYATPGSYKPSDFPSRFTNGVSTREPSMFYERPWMGDKWGVRDAIEYMVTVDFAILNLAATHRGDYLLKSYQMARQSIERGKLAEPYAYAVPADQWDRPTAVEMLERLTSAGVEVRRARAPFTAAGKSYARGSYVLLAAQPFRAYLMDLLEPQNYPKLDSNGKIKRPYDVAGWTLPMQMGVQVDRIQDRFQADLARETELKSEGAVSGDGPVVILDHKENAGFFAMNFVLGRGEKVRLASTGEIVLDSPYLENRTRVENFAKQFGITVQLRAQAPAKMIYELKQPRVALYQPWIANADEGWTEWLLDHYGIAYTLIHNDDFRKNDLRRHFDTIILAAQSANSILHGARDGEYASSSVEGPRVISVQRPGYAGGIEVEGLQRLDRFVRDGGTLIALDTATEAPIEYFSLPVKNVVKSGADSFYSPGSLLRVTVDTTRPVAFGMPKDAIVFSSGGEAFEITLAPDYNHGDREVRPAASFATKDLLASGWVSGEKQVHGKHALVEARYGRGHVVLFGFRPQFRGQSYGAFKFLLNAIYLGSAQPI
jgi:Zinc carboxypeptidase